MKEINASSTGKNELDIRDEANLKLVFRFF